MKEYTVTVTFTVKTTDRLRALTLVEEVLDDWQRPAVMSKDEAISHDKTEAKS